MYIGTYFCRRIYDNNSSLLLAFMGQMYCNNNCIMYGKTDQKTKNRFSDTIELSDEKM